MNDLNIPVGFRRHTLWLLGSGEGLAGSQAPKPLLMASTSPVYVGCLHIAQAAGLRAGQQEHIGLGVEGRGRRKETAMQGGQEEDKQECSPPQAAERSGPG